MKILFLHKKRDSDITVSSSSTYHSSPYKSYPLDKAPSIQAKLKISYRSILQKYLKHKVDGFTSDHS